MDSITRHSGCGASIGVSLFATGGFAELDYDNYMYHIPQIPPSFQSSFQQQFAPTNNSEAARFGHYAVGYKEYIYLFGGASVTTFQNMNLFCRFNVITMQGYNYSDENKFMPRKRVKGTGVLYNNAVYLFGGTVANAQNDQTGTTIVDKFDLLTEEQTAAITTGGHPKRQASAALDEENGIVYIMGGLADNDVVSNTLDILDLNTLQQSSGASMPQGFVGGYATFISGKVYYVMGFDEWTSYDRTYNADVLEYNPLTNTQRSAATVLDINNNAYRRAYFFGNTVDNTISIYDGQHAAYAYGKQTLLKVKDGIAATENNKWSRFYIDPDDLVPNLSVEQFENSGLIKSFIYDGIAYQIQSNINTLGADKLNLSTYQWAINENSQSMSGVHGMFGADIVGNKIYVYGGSSTELCEYDIGSDSQTSLGDNTLDDNNYLSQLHAYQNKLYAFVAHGDDINEDIYIYNISTATWSKSNASDITIFSSSETLLYNGNIYMFTGTHGQYIWIYNIAQDTFSRISCPTIPELEYQSGVVVGDIAYFYGGNSGSTIKYSPHLYAYNFATNTQSYVSTCLTYDENEGAYDGRSEYPSVFLYDNKLFVWIGKCYSGYQSSHLDIYKLPAVTQQDSSEQVEPDFDLGIDVDQLNMSNDVYRSNRVTGNYSKITTLNTPPESFGHASFKVTDDLNAIIGGALEKSLAKVSRLPIFATDLEVIESDDYTTMGFVDLVDSSSYLIADGSLGMEEILSEDTTYSFGGSPVAGEDGWYARLLIGSTNKLINMIIEISGGSICRTVLHELGDIIPKYDQEHTFPIIIDVEKEYNEIGDVCVYLELPKGTKINHIQVKTEIYGYY